MNSLDEKVYNLVQNFSHGTDRGQAAMPKKPTEQRTGTARAVKGSAVKVQFAPDAEPDVLQTQLQELAKEIAAGLSTLESSQSKTLLGSFVSELFLSMAKQDQMDFRRKKQAEGIAAAKARGVRFGVQRKPLPDNFDECYEAWLDGQMSAVQASAACGMTRHTFSRAAHEKKEAASRAV